MKRNLIIWIVFGVLVLLILFFAVWLKSYMPKYKWYESYSYKSDQPYGTKLMFDLLEQTAGKKNFHLQKKALTKDFYAKNEKSSYLFIGASFIVDTLELEYLIDYVKHGNNVFIACNEMDALSLKKLIVKCPWNYENNYYTSKFTNINFLKNVKNLVYQEIDDTLLYNWSYIDTVNSRGRKYHYHQHCFDTLAVNEYNLVTCLKSTYGNGNIYIHSFPISLTNLHLIQQENLAYFNQLFDFIADSKTIYWDEFHKAPSLNFGGQQNFAETPLKYVLMQKELRWAWYLGLVILFIFIVFKAKREQAAIPIIPSKLNSSIEFAQAIGSLYFQSKDHVKIGDEMLKSFHIYIRNKYHLDTKMKEEELKPLISLKSGIDIQYINEIYRSSIKLRFSPIANNEELIKHFQILQYFYKNCN